MVSNTALSATCDFRFVMIICAALSTAGFLGCDPQGPDLGPFGQVSGRVTHKNKPVTNATITFTCPKSGQVATADLQLDGTYTMRLNGREGLPVGKYLAYLLPDLVKMKKGETDFSRDRSPYNPDIAPEIAMKYRDESSSGFTAEVVEGKNRFDFDLLHFESEE